jgi:hypothetical protein
MNWNKKIGIYVDDIYIDKESGEYMVNVDVYDDESKNVDLIISPFKYETYQHDESRELNTFYLAFNSKNYDDKYLVRFW